MARDQIKSNSIHISDLSKHLFWDVDSTSIDFEKNKRLIIHRVMDYGLFIDWKILIKLYGIEEIAKIAIQIIDLDKRSASLISLLSGIPKDQFKCYTTPPLMPQHWSF
ncbi:MAG TPA: hypothetical protein DCG75_10190 [Bacteroidales bacterium]|nr:hypothetical protein [Bacteroidales bacterium]